MALSSNYIGLKDEYSTSYYNPIETIEPVNEVTPVILQAIRTIEKNILMPARTEGIQYYTRFYALDNQNLSPFLRGIFIRPASERSALYGLSERRKERFVSEFIHNNPKQNTFVKIPKLPNVYLVRYENLPRIEDGGCGIVNVFYDLPNKSELIGIEANDSDPTIHGICNGYG